MSEVKIYTDRWAPSDRPIMDDILAGKEIIETEKSRYAAVASLLGSDKYYRQIDFNSLNEHKDPNLVDSSDNHYSETDTSDSSNIPPSKVICKKLFRILIENLNGLHPVDHYEFREGDILLAKDLGDAWEVIVEGLDNQIVSSEFLELTSDTYEITPLRKVKYVPNTFKRFSLRNGRRYKSKPTSSDGNSGIIFSPYVTAILSHTVDPMIRKTGPFSGGAIVKY